MSYIDHIETDPRVGRKQPLGVGKQIGQSYLFNAFDIKINIILFQRYVLKSGNTHLCGQTK